MDPNTPQRRAQRFLNLSFQRVHSTEGIAYAILADDMRLGVLAGDEARAFIDHMLALPRREVYRALIDVARKISGESKSSAGGDGSSHEGSR